MGIGQKLKVLVVDDTVIYRKIMETALSGMDNVEVVGKASTGKLALDKIRLVDPDIVLMDVEMPEMNGLEALAEIKKRNIPVGVIMISGNNRKSADNTIRALELGALDFIRKPESENAEESIAYIREHLLPIFTEFKNIHKKPEGFTAKPRKRPTTTRLVLPRKKPSIVGQFNLLAIGSSTGGPQALMNLIPTLPANFPVPVLIVQHMPEGFTESLSRNLNNKSPLNILEAQPDMSIESGNVYIAPGGKHLVVRANHKGAIKQYLTEISDAPPENHCKPSVDVLFRSLAESFEGNILTVILTGMGSDGARGVQMLKRSKTTFCITQSENSCVVYGMPRAVDEEGLSDYSLSLEEMGAEITNLIGVGKHANISTR